MAATTSIFSTSEKKSETKELPQERIYSKPNLRIPVEVERKDLEDSGLLYSASVIQAIQKEFANSPDDRYSKHRIREKLKKYGFPAKTLNYAVIKNDNEFYIVYKGTNQSVKAHRIDRITGKVRSFLAGEGHYGKVKILQKISSGNWCVAKIISNRHPPNEREVEILKQMGLCIFHKVYTSAKKGRQHHIIQPYLPDFDCFDAFASGTRFYANKGRLIKLFLEMAKQIQKLHRLGYLHCDIKPENFRLDALIDSMTLIDMGVAVPEKSSKACLRGTPDYLAPEVVGSEITYSEKVDVYSLYQSFFRLFSHGNTPFVNYVQWNNRLDKYPHQTEPNFIFYKQFRTSVLEPMLHQDPALRCSMAECIKALEAMQQDYPLDNSSQNIDIDDFFAARNKKAFLAAIAAFPGVNHIVDNKSHHSLLQHSEFQQALCEAGVRTGHYIVGKSLIPAAITNDFSNMITLLNSESDLSVKTRMIKEVVLFYISENNTNLLKILYYFLLLI